MREGEGRLEAFVVTPEGRSIYVKNSTFSSVKLTLQVVFWLIMCINFFNFAFKPI